MAVCVIILIIGLVFANIQNGHTVSVQRSEDLENIKHLFYPIRLYQNIVRGTANSEYIYGGLRNMTGLRPAFGHVTFVPVPNNFVYIVKILCWVVGAAMILLFVFIIQNRCFYRGRARSRANVENPLAPTVRHACV